MPPRFKKPIAKQIILPDENYSQNTDDEKRLIQKACIRLLDGTYTGDFEKLSSYYLYSMRLEGKGRILLAKLVLDGLATLVLVECLFTHEYHQSKCLNSLRPTALSQYINKCAQGPVYILNETGDALELQTIATSTHSEPATLLEYGGCFIKTSDAQNHALQEHATGETEIVYGEAGSGKTLVLMHRIARLAKILATDESITRKIWVIVPHTPLQRHLEQEWRNQSVYQEIEASGITNLVQIVTPNELYRCLDNVSPLIQTTNHSTFFNWLSEEDFKSMHKLFGIVSKMQIYQELCLFNSLNMIQGSVAAAIQLYQKQELSKAFLECSDKQRAAIELASILQQYQRHLTITDSFDAYVYPFKTQLPNQDYYFLDEAQNLPPNLLLTPHAFISMNDSQSLRFARRTNEILLFHMQKALICTELPGSHRCPKQPTKLSANVDAFVLQKLHPKRKQASTSSPLKVTNHEEGLVCLVEDTSPDELATLREMVQMPDTAVVYLTHESEKFFQQLEIAPLCAFTPDNPILGLEFKRILIAQPFQSQQKNIYKIDTIHDELTGNQIAELELFMNALKAAMTRTTDTLVIFQPQTHGITELVNFLKQSVVCSPWLALMPTEINDKERILALYQQAGRLYREGQIQMAIGIIKHLALNMDNFLSEMNGRHTSDHEAQKRSINATQTPAVSTVNQLIMESPPSPKVIISPPAAAESSTTSPNSIDMTPLDSKLYDYVESLFNKITTNNLKALLNHKRAAYILFHHKMKNGYCLFLNLFFDNKSVSLIHAISEKNSQESTRFDIAVSSIPEQNYFLRFALSHLELTREKISSTMREKMLNLKQIRNKGLGYLFIDGTIEQQSNKLDFLVTNYQRDLTAADQIHQAQFEDGTLAPSFCHLLSKNMINWSVFLQQTQSRP